MKPVAFAASERHISSEHDNYLDSLFYEAAVQLLAGFDYLSHRSDAPFTDGSRVSWVCFIRGPFLSGLPSYPMRHDVISSFRNLILCPVSSLRKARNLIKIKSVEKTLKENYTR